MMDVLEQQLLDLLMENSRESVTNLAKKLGVSRVTVQERMRRLEHRKVIQAYTVRLNPEYTRNLISVQVMISVDPKQTHTLVRQLEQMRAVKSLHSVSGEYDFVALLQETTTEDLERQIDRIGEIEGVLRTMSSIVLSKKIER